MSNAYEKARKAFLAFHSMAIRMAGHKTEAIYRRYRIVDEQDLRDAAARLDAAYPARNVVAP